MKVSVLGAGAVGSLLGGLLKADAPDVEVTLITRGEHGRVLAERGSLLIDGFSGTREVRVAASSDPAAVAGSDIVLVTVKSQDTESAVAAAAPHWGDATVVSIQNGINDARLLKFVEPRRLVMGMTAANVALVEPGRVSLQLAASTVLGPPAFGWNAGSKAAANIHASQLVAAQMAAAESVVGLLSGIRGLRFSAHPNAVGVRYNKLAVNSLGFASSLSASNFVTEALAHRGWRNAVGLPIVRECRRVFGRAGIRLAPIPGLLGLPRLERRLRLMNVPVAGRVIAFGAGRLFNRRRIVFSLQQDLERGKATEVDFVNGEVVRLAESAGVTAAGNVAAPANALVVRLVRELEARDDRSFFSREEVIRRFAELG